MKALTIALTVIGAGLSACILIPAPSWVLLPFTLAASELSPFLLLLNLLSLLLALQYYPKVVPVSVLAACAACYPMYQAGRSVNLAVLLTRCVESLRAPQVAPRKLPLNMLFYEPREPKRRTAVVDIYGGAWQRGQPGDDARFDSYLATRGFAVVAIDYRHAPQFQFPAQLDDVETALRFLASHSGDYNFDGNRIFVCGRSAGGELALLAAYKPDGVPVRGVISFYGPTDMTRGYYDKPVPDVIDVQSVLRTYLGGTPTEKPDAYLGASPVHFVRPGLPPTLLIQGGRDHIVKSDFATELYEKLQANGDHASLVLLPWSEHAFDFVFPGLGNQICLPYVDDFLRQ